ncbi:MAG: oxidoreductase [Solirubrobacterales bacterium]|nr:oxidoreductase [Solirubrobacterales bacterium]
MSQATLTAQSLGTAPGLGRLTDRRVLVVGAGTRPSPDPDAPVGNGRAVARLVAREGAQVACVDLSLAAAVETVRQIHEQEGGSAVAVQGDIADPAGCEALVAAVFRELGGIDDIVINVGFGAGMSLDEHTAEVWDHVFAGSLRGHALVLRAAMRHLREGSSVVLMSSVASSAPSFCASYDATKAGLEALARHVASANAAVGIRVNALAPGVVDTPLAREYAADSGLGDLGNLGIPMGRQATGWDVAHCVVFLLSPEAGYITGHTLVVDGGFLLHGPH